MGFGIESTRQARLLSNDSRTTSHSPIDMPLLGRLLSDVAGADTGKVGRPESVADTLSWRHPCCTDGHMPTTVWR